MCGSGLWNQKIFDQFLLFKEGLDSIDCTGYFRESCLLLIVFKSKSHNCLFLVAISYTLHVNIKSYLLDSYYYPPQLYFPS